MGLACGRGTTVPQLALTTSTSGPTTTRRAHVKADPRRTPNAVTIGRVPACRRFAILAFALVLFQGCSGTHPVFVVYARNESAQPVSMTFASGADGVLARQSTGARTLPPWKSGLCASAPYALMAWPITVTISGPSMPAPFSKTWDEGAAGEAYVVVRESGAVDVQAGPPDSSGSCEPYQFGDQDTEATGSP